MIISKQKHILITFDKDVIVSAGELASESNLICLDLHNDIKKYDKEKSILVIKNPGEYEFRNILIKVTPDNNIYLSGETTKVVYLTDTASFIKDKNAEVSDICIFDNVTGKSFSDEDIINIQKSVQPKVIIVNKEALTGNLETAEKINKLKLKNSDLNSITETKIYLM